MKLLHSLILGSGERHLIVLHGFLGMGDNWKTLAKQFSNLVKEIVSSNEKTLYLAIYNSSNQRSYITVKLK